MLNNNPFFKENKIHIIRIIIMSVIGIGAILADLKFEIMNNSLNELITILFSAITVIAGLWISCYLLFLQLYKDRYPMKILKECYLPNMKCNFIIVIFCIIYGCVVIVINNGIIANLYYSVLCIFTIIEIMVKIYNTNKSIMINTYVDKVFEEINRELDNSKNIIKKETFENVRYILDESIVKEEYFIVQNITERLGDVYRTFLKNSLRFKGENTNTQDIESSFDNIVAFNISELKLCRKINSEITVDKLIKQQIKNIDFCIEKNQYEWFKKYIKEYSIFLFKTQQENNFDFTDKLYTTYKSITKKLINDGKKEWVKYINNELTNVIESLIFFYDNSGIKSYCSFISGAMIYCIVHSRNDMEIYKDLLNSFKKFSSLISKNSGSFNNVKMFYSFLFNKLLSENFEQALSFYEQVLEKSFGTSEDPIFLEFKIYCISELIDKSKSNNYYKKELLNKQINVLIQIIDIKDKYQGYYLSLPDFEILINESQHSQEEFKNIKDKIFQLLNNCIVKDNLPIYYTLFHNLNKILSNTEQRQKEIQEKLIDIYISFIFKTRTLSNKQYLEITFQLFENIIRELDAKRKISNSLGDYIITSIANATQNCSKDKHTIIIKSIDLLHSFLDEEEQLNFIVSSADKKKKLYRTMFNIGTDCIENDFEEGLRRVSNAIGWFTIDSIKQGNRDLALYLIERAIELYKISKSMEISSKTLIFILTLFTTVGTFCFTNNMYLCYLNEILKGISTEEIAKVKTAINLRTSENDMWNDLFDNDTIALSNKFISKFESIKNKQ